MTSGPTAADAGATAPMGIEPGLCSVTFRGLRPAEVIDVAGDAGLRHIEWGADVHVKPGDTAAGEQAARRCADLGIGIPSYGTYLTAGKLETGEEKAGTVAANLDSAEALGAPNIRVWAVGDTAAEELATICSAAVGRGIGVSVEYHPGTVTETARGALDLLDAVGADNLFTYWQPDPELEADDQLHDLASVAHHLSHVHVFSWKADRTRLGLDAGADLWPAAFALLGERRLPEPPGGTRVALLEFVRDDDPARLAADADVLLRWLGNGS